MDCILGRIYGDLLSLERGSIISSPKGPVKSLWGKNIKFFS